MCGDPSLARNPEVILSEEFKNELGVDINPQALRMFIRHRWHILSPLAHAIHGKPKKEQKQPKFDEYPG